MTYQGGPDSYITPSFGQVGTNFHFFARYLDPRMKMKISITDPNKKQIYNQDFVTDNQGDIDVEIRTTRDWLIGGYIVTAIGKYEGIKLTLHGTFELTI